MAEGNRFGQLLVQTQHLGDRPPDLRDLERVREARAVVIAGRGEEHLRLVLEASEGLAVDDAVPIALERRTDRILRFRPHPPFRAVALGRGCGQDLVLALLELLSNRTPGLHPPPSVLRLHHLRISRRNDVPWASGLSMKRFTIMARQRTSLFDPLLRRQA